MLGNDVESPRDGIKMEQKNIGAVVLLIIVFILNILSFGVFGLHWIVLWQHCGCSAYSPNRKTALYHFASYIVAAGLLSLGIWCRSSDAKYVTCADGADMSRDCLWQEQRPVYQLNYALHFFGLAWIGVHLVMDALSLPWWLVDVYRGSESLRLFGSKFAIDGVYPQPNSYFAWMIGAWVTTTLTWTVLYDWNTNKGLGGLSNWLIGQIMVWWLLGFCYFRYRKVI